MNSPRAVRRRSARRLGALVASFAAAFGVAASAAAQPYPSKPVRLVVPYPPGGLIDIVGRITAPRLGEALGQPVVVENRAGSGGHVGSEAVARAAPDGYTLLLGAPHLPIGPSLYKGLGYDPLRDLAPVALVGSVPNVLTVGPARPFRTVKELVDFARANPGRLNYASNGSGTSLHLSAELMKRMTKTFIVHIPYRGAAAATTALVAGEVDLMFDNLTPALPQIRAGKVRPLAVTSLARSPALPDVPTMAEAGLDGYDVTAWFGFLVPAKTPREVLDRLEDAARRVAASPEVAKALAAQGAVARFEGAQSFDAFLARETVKWADVVKFSGATVD
jgi:tripartite-type tricarboxylate transporter receptor subunit TctC